MMFGAAVGAVGSGWLSFKLGRKKSLMIGAILFVAGSLFSAAAPNVEILLVSRVLLGLAVGVASYTAPLPVRNRAGENPRQYDFDVPADDHHRYFGRLPV